MSPASAINAHHAPTGTLAADWETLILTMSLEGPDRMMFERHGSGPALDRFS
jgi:hypothetical protein